MSAIQRKQRNSILSWFQDQFTSTPMSVSSSEEDERFKIEFVRILMGFVILSRYLPIAYFAPQFLPGEHGLSGEFWFSLLMVILAVAFLVGFLTPLANILLILLSRQFDIFVGAQTLGTTVGILVLTVFLLLGSGRLLSVDSLILNRYPNSFVTRLIGILYRLIGTRSSKQIQTVYILGFACFSAVSFGAAQWHFFDPLWIAGRTMEVGFTNAYLCSWWPLFRWMGSVRPELLTFISLSATVFQSIWEILMFPLVFIRKLRWFPILFGFTFFILSEFCLVLSTLPRSELCLWLLLFIPARTFLYAATLGNRFQQKPSSRQVKSIPVGTGKNLNLQKYLIPVYYGLIIFYLSTQPWFSPWFDKDFREARKREKPITYLGFWTPDVFTEKVMAIGNRWPVIHRELSSESDELVPFTSPDGERMSYQAIDPLFYGLALPMTKTSVGEPLEYFTEGRGFATLKRICSFDYNRKKQASEIESYRIDVFESEGDNLSLPIDERFAKRKLVSIQIPVTDL